MRTASEQSPTVPFRILLSNIRWALKQAWSLNALLTTGLISVALLQSALPAGLALITRGLINAVATTLHGGHAAPRTLFFWFALGLGLSLMETLSRPVGRLLTQRLHEELNVKITSDILLHAATLDLSLFEDPRFQDVMERAQQNTAEHFSQFLSNLLASATHTLHLVSLTGILMVCEPTVLLVLVPIGLPYFFSQWRLARTRYHKDHTRATNRRWLRYFSSRLTSAPFVAEVKLLNLAPVLFAQCRALMEMFRHDNHKLETQQFTSQICFSALSTIAFYLTFVRVVLRAVHGGLTIGDIVMYGGVAPNLRRVLENAIFSSSTVLERALYITNLREFLSLQPRITTRVGLTLPSSRGEIEFRNVSFTYPGCERPAVSEVSFHICPGETVALVGESGAGKTTLIKLLARLYDPDQGSILFDGCDLRDVAPPSLHNQFSFVFQNFGRYETTAAENIAYGDWPRMMQNREQVEHTARLAHVHDLIETLPRGYDTSLGRMFGEYSLSEGQWQKLAVARAFAREASVFILDEPTSSLDVRSEHLLFSRFHELAKGRTTILISHRFSLVSMADRILVMEKGRLVECGTHQELLKRAGHYAALYEVHQRHVSVSLMP